MTKITIDEIPQQVVERLLCQAIVIAREKSSGYSDAGYILGKLNSFPALDTQHLEIFKRIAEIFKEEIGIELDYYTR